MLGLPIFGRKKLLLAFEYGIAIANVAHENNVELTPQIVKNAEIMIENEARTQSDTHFATLMVPNILSAFELDITK
jgi:hypothetical protein